jgi:signal transduction histidine kinase
LLFAPVVVGFAAFAQRRQSFVLLGAALALLGGLAVVAPSPHFPTLPAFTLRAMLLVSSATSFALLFVGVSGLIEAHARTASELDRLRADMLAEAERRAASVEHLGAQVAHEVKNPLAAARGLVELVQRRTSDERDQQRLTVVVTEIDRALQVLHDYLSFARPLSDLSLAALSPRSLLEDVAGVVEARAREKSISIEISADKVEAFGDRQRLRDALLNVALNAISALPPGGHLELRAARVGKLLCFDVIDDGSGIQDEIREKLGQPFASGTTGGTGLGVMLAQSVARQHGGALRFESSPGTGTRVSLELPLGHEPASGEPG